MKLRILNTMVLGTALLSATGILAAEATKETKQDDSTTVSVSPGLRYVWVQGDANRFRQDWWMNDKLSGGIESLKIQRALNNDWTLSLEGRAYFDESDYQVHLEIVNPKVGYVRAGYTEFRKYYDNSGGFYRFTNFGARQITLAQELQLDISDIYVDVGLTLPNWPILTLGYEHKAKDGEKSMVEWGSVTGTPANKNIYPAIKSIDDKVDILKAGIEHDISNVHLGDQFRYEWYKTSAMRLDDVGFIPTNAAPSKIVTVDEGYQHHYLINTVYVDSHVNDVVYLSGGYLFSHANGVPFIDVDTIPIGAISSSNHDKDWQTVTADLKQDSHVLNLNSMFGPFFKKTTTFSAGIQAEKTQSDARTFVEKFEPALGAPGLTADDLTGDITTQNNKEWFTEQVGVRCTAIPFTTVYANGKWEQGSISLFEEEITEGPRGLEVETGLPLLSETYTRYTDTDVNRQDYRVGFSTSPVAKLNLSSYYRYNKRDNKYNNLIDEVVEYDGVTEEAEEDAGYSAWIDRQVLESNEVGVKLALKLHSRLSLGFKYQLVATKIDTYFANPALSNETGDYLSNIYSVNATCMPVNRLFCSVLFSYQDTRTVGQTSGSTTVARYEGDVYSVGASAGYALDEKTDVSANYSFSCAHNSQASIAATGLPLGTDYTRHGVTVSLSRQLRDNVSVRLQYGFFDLKDGANNGLNDYSAHMLNGSCTIRF